MKANKIILGLLWLSMIIMVINATGQSKKKCSDIKSKDKCEKYVGYYKGRKGHCIYDGKRCRNPKNNCELFRPKKGKYGCEKRTCITSVGKGRVFSHPSKKFEKCMNDNFKNRCLANIKTGACDCHCHRERKIRKLPDGFYAKGKNKKELDVGTCGGSCPHYDGTSCKPIYECRTIVKKVRIHKEKHDKKGKKHKKEKKSTNNSKVHKKLIWKKIQLSVRVIKKCDCFKKTKYNDKLSGCNSCGKPCKSRYECGKYKQGSKSVKKYCALDVFYKNKFAKKYGCQAPTCHQKCDQAFEKCFKKYKNFSKCYSSVYEPCKKLCKCIASCSKHPYKEKCIKFCKQKKFCFEINKEIDAKCTKKCDNFSGPFKKGVLCHHQCQIKKKERKTKCCKQCKYLPFGKQKACYKYCEPKIEKCVRKKHCGKIYEGCKKRCGSKSGSDKAWCIKGCKAAKKRCPHECCVSECSHLTGYLKKLWHKKCYVIAGPHSEKCTHCLKEKKKCLDKLKYIKASEEVIKRLTKKCHKDYFKCNVKCRCRHTCVGKDGLPLKKCLAKCFNKHKPPKKDDKKHKKKDHKKKDHKKKDHKKKDHKKKDHKKKDHEKKDHGKKDHEKKDHGKKGEEKEETKRGH